MDKSPKIPKAETSDNVFRHERFVSYVIDNIKQDNGFAARLKRADNPATEYQSWELLADFGIDLENKWQRLPYCTVGAALARAKPAENGTCSLGSAIALSSEKGNQSDQAKARLRRLLACTSAPEACRILRPLLALMTSRRVTPDFSQVLNDLLQYTEKGQERVRARWANDFYHHNENINAAEIAYD